MTNNACDYNPTQHATLIGGANGAITSLVGSTSGNAFIAQGSSIDPKFSSLLNLDESISLVEVSSEQIGGGVQFAVSNTDNTSSLSASRIPISVGGTSAGDAYILFDRGNSASSAEIGMSASNGAFQVQVNPTNGSPNMDGTVALSATPLGAVTFPVSITLGAGTALSNYVQGSWTPVLSFGGGSTGITYNHQVGTYTNIGNVVFIQMQLELSNKGSDTGNALISGLPITSGSVSNNSGIDYFSDLTLTILYTDAFCQVNTSSTTMNLYQIGSSQSDINITDTSFSNSTKINMCFFYIISS